MNKHNYHIIAIDDNIALLQTLKVVLGAHFERVATISDPKMIQGILAGGNVDAVLLDMNFDNSKLDGSDGLFWLKILKERENAPAVILITAFGDINLAVESMKLGADDFVTKPWNNEELINKIVGAIRKNDLAKEEPEPDNSTLEETEREKIASVLLATQNNVSRAAKILGISRRTLYNKIAKYGL